MRYPTIAALLAALPGLALAQDFSEGSEAKEWGLQGERKARFEAQVTDLVCEVTADCPDDCGAGLRQIVLIRMADDTVVLPLKNGQPVFSGATFDLAPYCGETVEVDGVLIGDAEVTPGAAGGAQLYMVQSIRRMGEDTWSKADRFTKAWAERNPDAEGGEPWFRRDPEVKARIEAEGWFGLGQEVDEIYIKENF